jgi:hypothetical protein
LRDDFRYSGRQSEVNDMTLRRIGFQFLQVDQISAYAGDAERNHVICDSAEQRERQEASLFWVKEKSAGQYTI